MKRFQTHHWMAILWAAGGLTFLTVYRTHWGPQISTGRDLTLHLAASAGEILAVTLLLGLRQMSLAGNLLALLLVCLATVAWGLRATPTGTGVAVAHLAWLMLLLVVLAGRLGWHLFRRILERPRRY